MNDNSTTDSIDTLGDRLNYGTYGLAAGFVLILCCCNFDGKRWRPKFVIPVDLLVDDTFVYIYAAAFGCTSFAVLELILDNNEGKLVPSNVLSWIRVPLWLLIAVIASFKFYPIFAAIRHSTPIIGPVVGFLHCGYLMSETLVGLIQSKISEDNENEQIEIKVTAYFILINVPILVCFAILISYFLYKGTMDTVNVIRGVPYKTKLNMKHSVITGYERQYVRWLLQKEEDRKTKVETDSKSLQKLKSVIAAIKGKLNTNTPLRTSPRVVCTFVICGCIIFQTGVLFFSLYNPLRTIVVEGVHEILKNSTVVQIPELTTFIEVMDVSFYLSLSMATFVMAVYIVMIYRTYQQDLQKMYKGDFSFLPAKVRDKDNKQFVASSLRYSGTQIAYMFWCYIILFLTILTVCLVIAYALILPLMKKVPDIFLTPLKSLLPAYIAKYLFDYFKTVFIDRRHLQDHKVKKNNSEDYQHALALKNRTSFNVLDYFLFFFHVIIGFFGCISRILLGAAIGILTVARIDGSLLPRGYEHLDNGYAAYVGLIMFELRHRNPVLLVFCDELLTSQKNKSTDISLQAPQENLEYQKSVSDSLKRHTRQTLLRNKWYKAFTVVNNPSLREIYKPKLLRGFSEKHNINITPSCNVSEV